MITQERVDAHAREVRRQVSSFGARVSRSLDQVTMDVSMGALRSLRASGGIVEQSPENSKAVLSLEDVVDRALRTSDYHPTIIAFVEGFVGQVGAFREMHADAARTLRLSTMPVSRDGREVLSNQGAAAIAVFDGHVLKVKHDLRQFLARSLGSAKRSELVSGVNTIVRKMSEVEPMAKDQVMLWFRMLGSISYGLIEERVGPLMYRYVGRVGEFSRDFCKGARGKVLTRSQIDSLDNGQGLSPFVNGGGYGCCHWWAIDSLGGR